MKGKALRKRSLHSQSCIITPLQWWYLDPEVHLIYIWLKITDINRICINSWLMCQINFQHVAKRQSWSIFFKIIRPIYSQTYSVLSGITNDGSRYTPWFSAQWGHTLNTYKEFRWTSIKTISLTEYTQFACVGRSDLWGWQRQTYHGLVYWGISSPIAVGHFNQSLGAKTPPCVETVIIWFFSTTPWIDLPSLHWRGNCIPEYTFAKATKFPYGHLMVDLKPFTLEDQRLKVQYNMPTFLVSTTNCSNTVKHPR